MSVPDPLPPSPRAPRRSRRALLVGAALVLLVGLSALAWRRRDAQVAGGRRRVAIPGASLLRREARAPEGTRIRVEVLNATKTRGLARRATLQLRDRGFDVVEVGTTARQSDSVVVLDRSGHPEWARLVAQALGGGRVESRPDSSRYLDVTVLLGASWRPPAEPFYP
ncbi:MAG: LytR C-terminal domain-containing protein [Gemmatimonadaceae bacterium]